MRSVQQWISEIRSRVEHFATAADLAQVERALEQHPGSAELWILRGDLIQLEDPASDKYVLGDALRSYEQAVAVDPSCAEAHVEVGHYLDAIEDDLARALPYFERAVELGGGEAAEEALASARAQLEEGHDA